MADSSSRTVILVGLGTVLATVALPWCASHCRGGLLAGGGSGDNDAAAAVQHADEEYCEPGCGGGQWYAWADAQGQRWCTCIGRRDPGPKRFRQP